MIFNVGHSSGQRGNQMKKDEKSNDLMKSVAGNKWGASKIALLTIYRTLIRSRLDYGCEAYYTASKTQLARLDQIQFICLRIYCGALCGSATSALQQDCGEMPLFLRQIRNTARFAVKVSSNPVYPPLEITQLHWKYDLRSSI